MASIHIIRDSEGFCKRQRAEYRLSVTPRDLLPRLASLIMTHRSNDDPPQQYDKASYGRDFRVLTGT